MCGLFGSHHFLTLDGHQMTIPDALGTYTLVQACLEGAPPTYQVFINMTYDCVPAEDKCKVSVKVGKTYFNLIYLLLINNRPQRTPEKRSY